VLPDLLPTPGEAHPALWLAGALGLVVGLRTLGRAIRRSEAFSERVLLVGRGPLVAQIMAELATQRDRRYFIVGVLDNRRAACEDGAPLGDISRVIDAVQPERIVIASRGRRPTERCLLEWRLRGVIVEEAVTFYERVTGKLAIEALTPSTLILGDGFRHSDIVPSDLSLVVTRAMSLVAAIAGLLVFAPVLLIVAVAVKLDSAGPVLFVQTRIGRGGHPFGLLKFRTMHEGGESSLWVCDNEHRITRVGRWLRRFRLDELPQFVNVLRGEMNLVGPRPHPASNHQLFLERIPFYWLRASVRPGITGWAQVKYGYANGLDEETEKMRYDLYYIKHRSLSLDIRILLKTVAVLLFDRHSHAVTLTARRRSSWRAQSGEPLIQLTPR
jgi:exopolysaccharide biosynthesis polyprenyl glycosylphosphotransferase